MINTQDSGLYIAESASGRKPFVPKSDGFDEVQRKIVEGKVTREAPAELLSIKDVSAFLDQLNAKPEQVRKSDWTVEGYMSSSPMLEAMSLVRINAADSNIYRDILLTKRSTVPGYADFHKNLAEYIASIMLAINKAFISLRAITVKAAKSSKALTVSDIHDAINTAITMYDSKFDSVSKIAESYREHLAGGDAHVIKTDTKTGMYVVEFCGFPAKQEAGLTMTLNAKLNGLADLESRSADAKKLSEYVSFTDNDTVVDVSSISNSHPNFGLLAECRRTAAKLLYRLFESKLTANGNFDINKLYAGAHRRVDASFSLNTDFAGILNGLTLQVTDLGSKTDKKVTLQLGDLLYLPKAWVAMSSMTTLGMMDKYITINLYKEPDPTLASIYLKQLDSLVASSTALSAKPATGESINSSLSRFIDNKKYIQATALLLQPVISGSYSISIPNGVVKFITQSDTPTMFAMNSWLSVWLQSAIKPSFALEQERVPLFVFPMQRTGDLIKLREDHGFPCIEGKNNEDGIFINDSGRLNYAPKTKDDTGAMGNSILFSKAADTCMENAYSIGSPFTVSSVTTDSQTLVGHDPYHSVLLLPDPENPSKNDIASVIDRSRKAAKVLTNMDGALLGFSWDNNVLIKASLKETKSNQTGKTAEANTLVNYIGLSSASSPDILDIADYLGFSFGTYKVIGDNGDEKELENSKSSSKSYSLLFPKSYIVDRNDNSHTSITTDTTLDVIADTSPFLLFLDSYCYFYIVGKLKSLGDIISDTRKKAPWDKIKHFSDKDTPQDWNRTGNLYKAYINDNFDLVNKTVNDVLLLRNALRDCFELAVLESCALSGRSKGILRNMHKSGRSVEPYRFKINGDLASFKNVYNFFGGSMFLTAVKTFLNLPIKDVLSFANIEAENKALDDFKARIENLHNATLNAIKRPTFDDISTVVYPFCHVFGDYIVNSANIFQEAASTVSKYRAIPDMTDAPEITVPDVSPDLGAMPSQAKALARLESLPHKAILDISAGGGKTFIYIIDMARAIAKVRDFIAKNPDSGVQPIRPVVVCPDNLVRNVCDEAVTFLGNTWNVIPFTTDIFSKNGTWGADKINSLLFDKNNPIPPNTLFVVGYSFLMTNRFNISVGNRVTPVYGAVEVIRKLRPNFIVFDESHYLKRKADVDSVGAKRYLVSKVLASDPQVEYIRLATGTLTPNTALDILGQAGIISNGIFKTEDEFKVQFYRLENGKATKLMRADARDRIAGILSGFTCFIKARRRDWAYLYPDLRNKLVNIPFSQEENEDGTPNTLGILHKSLYDAILGRAVEEFQKQMGLGSKPSGAPIRDSSEGVMDVGMEGDDPMASISDDLLRYYLQRLEQVIIDPFGDVTIFSEFGKKAEDLDADKSAEVEAFEASMKKSRMKEAEKKAYRKKFMDDLDRKYELLNKVSAFVQDVISNRDSLTSDVSNYFSPKVMECVNIVKRYFEKPAKWNPNESYPVYSRVFHEGYTYIARRLYKQSETEDTVFQSKIPPSKDDTRWYKKTTGARIIFVCSYTRTALLLQRAFQTLLSGTLNNDQIRMYIGSGAGTEQELYNFANPVSDAAKIRGEVLIANINKIQVGHNLQISDVIVRVEKPWTPGEEEQSVSRTYRPDHRFKDEKLRRPVIDVEWLLSNNSLEIPKMMRLIGKTVETIKFNEHGNPNYALLDSDEMTLPIVSMSRVLLSNSDSYDSENATKYFGVYHVLQTMLRQDIDQAREATSQTPYYGVTASEAPDDFKAMPFKPMVADQKMKDIHGLGLLKLSEFIQNPTITPKFVNNPDILNGRLVMTQYGTGTIVSTQASTQANMIDVQGKKIVQKSKPILSVKIKLLNCFAYMNSTIVNLQPQSVFMIRNAKKAEQLGLTVPVTPLGTKRGRKVIDQTKMEADRAAIIASMRAAIHNGDSIISSQSIVTATNTAVDIQNGQRGSHIDADLNVSDIPAESPVGVGVYPIVINNQYGLIADASISSAVLTRYGFTSYGGFISADVTRIVDFVAAFKYLEDLADNAGVSLHPDSVLEYKAIRKLLYDHVTTGGINNIKLPLVKTTDLVGFLVAHSKPMSNNLHVFYMFYASMTEQGSVDYHLKVCADTRNRSLFRAMGVNLGSATSYTLTEKGKSFRCKFSFKIEPVQALLLLKAKSGTASMPSSYIADQAYTKAMLISKALLKDKVGYIDVDKQELEATFNAFRKVLVDSSPA